MKKQEMTKEQEDKLDNTAMLKCLDILKGINDVPGDASDYFQIKMKKILSAFKAINDLCKAKASYYPDERHIVASAIIADMMDLEGCHPYSGVGDTICAFVQVCLLMNVKSELESLLDTVQFGTRYAEDIEKLLG